MEGYKNIYTTKFHNEEIQDLSFLVTGGCGFIGSNIVEYLLLHNAGHVRVLDDLSNGFEKNIRSFLNHKNFEFIKGDIRDLEICQRSCEGVDYVLHQAALGSVPRSIKNPALTNSVNVDGFLNMLIASRDQNVKRFIYAASSSTYGDSKVLPKEESVIGRPLSPYAITKFVNELYARIFNETYGLECVGLRYFNVFGPRQDPKGAYAAVIPMFMDAIVQNVQPLIHGDGGQTRDFTFVANAVEANIKAVFANLETLDDKVFNVACGERTSILNILKELKRLSKSNIETKHGPDRAGDIRDSHANINKSKKHLGYDPKFNFLQGLELTFGWFKDHQDFITQR